MANDESSLISIVYVSSATRLFREDLDVIDILRASRSNNTRLGITGLLLYKEGNFMQVLEGPERIVLRLIDRVRSDVRHTGFIVLIKKRIAKTSFEDWSMGFRNLSELTPDDQQAHNPFLSSSLLDGRFQSNPEECYKLLLTFKSTMR